MCVVKVCAFGFRLELHWVFCKVEAPFQAMANRPMMPMSGKEDLEVTYSGFYTGFILGICVGLLLGEVIKRLLQAKILEDKKGDDHKVNVEVNVSVDKDKKVEDTKLEGKKDEELEHLNMMEELAKARYSPGSSGPVPAHEAHPELRPTLRMNWDSFKVEYLKECCREYGLPVSGLKKDLVERLRQYELTHLFKPGCLN